MLLFWMGLSILFLAYSILKFSNTLLKVNTNVPEIINQVEVVNQRLDSISTRTVPNILRIIPPILSRIDGFQTEIPSILSRVDSITKQIPNITNTIQEVTAITDQALIRVDSINKEIPGITTTVEEVIKTTDEVVIEADSINSQIPKIINVVNVTNDSISDYIDRTEVIVAKANNLAKDAGKNATRGIIGGITSIPFDVIKGAGQFVLGKNSKLTERDVIEAEKKAMIFLNENSTENEFNWNSEKVQKSGTIKIVRSYHRQGKDIKKVKLLFDGYKDTFIIRFYQKDDRSWFFLN